MKNLNLQVTLLVQKGEGTPFPHVPTPPHYTPGYRYVCSDVNVFFMLLEREFILGESQNTDYERFLMVCFETRVCTVQRYGDTRGLFFF